MKPRGFTLVELIVVVSIVAMLIALTLQALRRAREQAKAVVCQSKIRQLLVQFQQYEAEHEALPYGFAFRMDRPPPGRYMGNLAVDPPGWFWPNFLEVVRHRSRRDFQPLECPSKRLDDYALQRSVLCGNYGVNRSVCRSGGDVFSEYEEVFGGPPLSSSTIRHPGETLLLVDSGYALISWWQACDDPPIELPSDMAVDTAYIPGMAINKDRELWSSQIDDAVGGRHPNKAVNAGFVDGHVETKKADDLLVEKIDEETYDNLSPLWEPD